MFATAISDLVLTLTYLAIGLHHAFFVWDRQPAPVDPETARSRNT